MKEASQMARIRFHLLAVCGVISMTAAAATAQDFHKSYGAAAGATVIVHNVSGDVIVRGYDGAQVIVDGVKTGADRNMVSVEDLSQGDRIELRAHYPHNCECDASIKFEVQVPRSIGYVIGPISTASGDINVSDVIGQVSARSASGDVVVRRVTGQVTASTASGDVEVDQVTGPISARSSSGNVTGKLDQLDAAGELVFTTASGDVRVQVPSTLNADVEIHTISGSLNTDFPLQINVPRYGPSRSAQGRLGDGSHVMRISSASGNVTLTSRQAGSLVR
jgi:hypothetical protein